MKSLQTLTLLRYSEVLASKEPAPGGGSAAAYVGALGVALVAMAAQYSVGRSSDKTTDKKIRIILRESQRIRRKLLKQVDRDAEAYSRVVATRKAAKRSRQAALRRARRVPLETCVLCYEAIHLVPFLVQHGNRHLISDLEAAVELLEAAYLAAMANVRANQ